MSRLMREQVVALTAERDGHFAEGERAIRADEREKCAELIEERARTADWGDADGLWVAADLVASLGRKP